MNPRFSVASLTAITLVALAACTRQPDPQPQYAGQPGGPGYQQQPGGPGYQQQPGGPGYQQQPGGPGYQPQPTGPGYQPQPGQPQPQPGQPQPQPQPQPGQPAPGGFPGIPGFPGFPGMPGGQTGGGGAGGGGGGSPGGPVSGPGAALQPLLMPLQQQHAPGSTPEGAAISAFAQQGTPLTTAVTFQPNKCYTAIAVASPPVSDVLIELVANPGAPFPPTTLTQQAGGAQTVASPQPNCFRNPSPAPVPGLLRVTVRAGAGPILAQLYGK